jgi:hypothetical protein
MLSQKVWARYLTWSHCAQDLLEDTVDGGDSKWFFQAPHATLLQETSDLRHQGIPGEEDNPLAQAWLLLRQELVEPRAVEL